MAWTIAALSSEVTTAKPLGAMVGSREIALFRDADGICRALEDRCAHRRAPLSTGKITANGLIECPYHGWRYEGAGGACKAIPNLSQTERVPGNYRVAAYPCAETAGFVWIGDEGDDGLQMPGDPAFEENASAMAHEGGKLIAYPAENYRRALLNVPSAILAVAGHQIIDNHQLGVADIGEGYVKLAYAVDVRRRVDPDKPALTPADFPYSLEIHSAGLLDQIVLRGPEHVISDKLMTAIPLGDGLCRVIWRERAKEGAGPDLLLRDALDANALFKTCKAAAKVEPPHNPSSGAKGTMA